MSRAPASRATSAQAAMSQTLSSGFEIVSASSTRGLTSSAFSRNYAGRVKSAVTVLTPNEPKTV